MGKDILTPHQKAVLALAVGDPEITDNYYLSGGTALAAFYFKHRLSDDLDFFTASDVNVRYLKEFFTKHTDILQMTHFDTQEHHEMIFFYLSFKDGTELIVDFATGSGKQIEKGIYYKKLAIDSIFDIAINKLAAMSDRTRARDYVDLYFILKTQDISLEQVYARIIDKFGYHFDTMELGRKLLYMTDMSDYPTMLVPFAKEDMINFYLREAKKLEPKIFK